jgi:hypothetical protein
VLVAIPGTKPTIAEKQTKLSLSDMALWPWLFAGLSTIFAIVTMQISAGFYFQDSLGLTNE